LLTIILAVATYAKTKLDRDDSQSCSDALMSIVISSRRFLSASQFDTDQQWRADPRRRHVKIALTRGILTEIRTTAVVF
jgi:hypothetical protein